MKNKIDDIRITILDYVVWVLAIIIVSYIFSVVIGSYILGVGIQGIMYVIGHKYILLGTMLCTIILCCPVFYVAHLQYERSYVLRRLRGMRKAVDGNLENSHFITKKEMLTSGYRIYETKEELQNAEDGILLHFEEYKKGKLKSIFSPETIHTLILGTTGSGKTSSYIIPSIKALSITKTKPSFMFTDPKGELYEKTAQHLKEQGY